MPRWRLRMSRTKGSVWSVGNSVLKPARSSPTILESAAVLVPALARIVDFVDMSFGVFAHTTLPPAVRVGARSMIA